MRRLCPLDHYFIAQVSDSQAENNNLVQTMSFKDEKEQTAIEKGKNLKFTDIEKAIKIAQDKCPSPILVSFGQYIEKNTKENFLMMLKFEGTLIDFMFDVVNLETDHKEIYEIMLSVTEPLIDLHATGIIHKDLKPNNIFYYGKDLKFVLGDLGLACLSTDDKCVRELVGTRFYFPHFSLKNYKGKPEEFDYYSLGMIFVLLTVRSSWDYIDKSLKEIHNWVKTKLRCEIGKIEWLNQEIKTIIYRMLQLPLNNFRNHTPLTSLEELVKLLRELLGFASKNKKIAKTCTVKNTKKLANNFLEELSKIG